MFFRFLQKLPKRDRNLYLILNQYHETMAKFNSVGDISLWNQIEELAHQFEEDILVVVNTTNPPIYDAHHRKEDAEPSIPRPKPLAKTDVEFDEKLGAWASSFSESEEDDDPKRFADNSDLSSRDEHIVIAESRPQNLTSAPAVPIMPPRRSSSLPQ